MPATATARTPRCLLGYEEPDTTHEPSSVYDETAPAGDARHLSLLAAVLRRAMVDYCLRDTHEGAKDWFTSPAKHPFSFQWIATHLNPNDPEGLKEKVLGFLTSDVPDVVQHRIGDTITF